MSSNTGEIDENWQAIKRHSQDTANFESVLVQGNFRSLSNETHSDKVYNVHIVTCLKSCLVWGQETKWDSSLAEKLDECLVYIYSGTSRPTTSIYEFRDFHASRITLSKLVARQQVSTFKIKPVLDTIFIKWWPVTQVRFDRLEAWPSVGDKWIMKGKGRRGAFRVVFAIFLTHF